MPEVASKYKPVVKAKRVDNPAEVTTCAECGVGRQLPAPCACPASQRMYATD